MLARDGPAAEGQVEAPEQQAEAAEPAAPSPAGADTPKASTEMSAKEAAAQALAREMAQLRAKIAAAEKRKKAARLQADPVRVPADFSDSLLPMVVGTVCTGPTHSFRGSSIIELAELRLLCLLLLLLLLTVVVCTRN